ncbi:MAG TPA: hypothetical protein VI341_06420 [Actinomycetota bacterium]
MNDTRDLLEKAGAAAPTVHPDLDGIYRRRERRRMRKRLSAGMVGLVVGVAVVAFAVGAMRQSGAERLGMAGGDRIGSPTQDLRIPDGQYYYQRFDSGYGLCESWWATDDSGRLDTAKSAKYQGHCWGAPNEGTFEAGDFYSDSGPVAQLSTDPDEVEAQLRVRVEEGGASPEPYEDWGGPVEWGLIRSIGELLEAPDVAPEQKAALMIVAARLSTAVDMHARDPRDRRAIKLTLKSENQVRQWWFDPDSHQPLVLDGFVTEAAGIAPSTTSVDLRPALVPGLNP